MDVDRTCHQHVMPFKLYRDRTMCVTSMKFAVSSLCTGAISSISFAVVLMWCSGIGFDLIRFFVRLEGNRDKGRLRLI